MNNETKQRLLGLLSHLLQYPDSEWRERLPDIRGELEPAPDACRREIAAFLDEAEAVDGVIWQDRYVRTFDFGKKSNMYLTYGRHGEERERGARAARTEAALCRGGLRARRQRAARLPAAHAGVRLRRALGGSGARFRRRGGAVVRDPGGTGGGAESLRRAIRTAAADRRDDGAGLGP
ncbi:hypothetical protein OMP38_18650 [Cohnella ginsengisoli]|uniref:Nitrate reductase molybdenum cofactor assembly chaperone n=1 Tax=Cohnella ginsengisoli TaxID=425004 RepID=A0A9X4KIM7_9BACL|nr:hypothetical protein [Cohnella ginsengisoli]MDG0792670.1 hypothetical protein [Cohnella ginsengisoli]